ncbi:MAG TPA: three-Cys-motif partner protein TcmP, partial [Terriglobales bacterium]|nr:three-Cys-motif partner protein TcmP [Terriglobales bacterium]
MAREDISSPHDDGLVLPEVGAWAEKKHRLVSLYADLFSSAMKGKWGKRVYLELYAGAGYSRIRGSSRLILGSPLRALELKNMFDKYVFCEENPTNLDALKIRAKRHAPSAEIAYVLGNCNTNFSDVLSQIPTGSRNSTVLSLCFADPFDISLKFETLKKLSQRYIDFLVLLALYMDANRNHERYLREDAVRVDEFLGSTQWRE